MMLFVVIGYIVVSFVLWVVCASIYKSGVTDKRPQFHVEPAYNMANADFKYGTFQCFDDMKQCICGCCCIDLRVGDTYQSTGVNSYWTMVVAIVAFFELTQLAGLGLSMLIDSLGLPDQLEQQAQPIAYYVLSVFFAMYMAQQRGKLRMKFGGQPKMPMDFVCWWCCFLVSR